MHEDINEGYPKILFFSSNHCAPCLPVEEKLKRINISLFGKKLRIEKISMKLTKPSSKYLGLIFFKQFIRMHLF